MQVAWLDSSADDSDVESVDEEPPAVSPPSSRKKPPRLPGAAYTLPPMPVVPSKTRRPPPPARHTMEVEMNWVELVDEKGEKAAKDEARQKPTVRPGSASERASVRPGKAKKPIPREEED